MAHGETGEDGSAGAEKSWTQLVEFANTIVFLYFQIFYISRSV